MTRMSFEEAKRRYIQRYTMEHVPRWALKCLEPGKFYAPQYRTDREWYDNTIFPGEEGYPFSKRETSCYTNGQSWPLGLWLTKPLNKGANNG